MWPRVIPCLTFYFLKNAESERKMVLFNKFWRRLKLLGSDLPYGSLKPRVIFYSKCIRIQQFVLDTTHFLPQVHGNLTQLVQAGSDLKLVEVEIAQNLVYIAKLVYFQASFISQLLQKTNKSDNFHTKSKKREIVQRKIMLLHLLNLHWLRIFL